MGLSVSKPLPRLPVPEGKIRLCVSGFGISHHTGRARKIADQIAITYPDKYETWYYFDSRGFRPEFITSLKTELSEEQQETFKSHMSSPFCWIEKANGEKPVAIGGRDRLCEWATKTFTDSEKDEPILAFCRTEPGMGEIFFDSRTPGTAKTTTE